MEKWLTLDLREKLTSFVSRFCSRKTIKHYLSLLRDRSREKKSLLMQLCDPKGLRIYLCLLNLKSVV